MRFPCKVKHECVCLVWMSCTDTSPSRHVFCSLPCCLVIFLSRSKHQKKLRRKSVVYWPWSQLKLKASLSVKEITFSYWAHESKWQCSLCLWKKTASTPAEELDVTASIYWPPSPYPCLLDFCYPAPVMYRPKHHFWSQGLIKYNWLANS